MIDSILNTINWIKNRDRYKLDIINLNKWRNYLYYMIKSYYKWEEILIKNNWIDWLKYIVFKDIKCYIILEINRLININDIILIVISSMIYLILYSGDYDY